MADNKNIQKFGAADIEKYHKGLLSPAQRHALEKAALDDPFLADALEGYDLAGLNISADIASLKERLDERTSSRKVIPIVGGGRAGIPWLRAAAIIVMVLGAGILFYIFNKKESSQNELAKNDQVVPNNQPSSNQVSPADSINSDLTFQYSDTKNLTIPSVLDGAKTKSAEDKENNKDKPGAEVNYLMVDKTDAAIKSQETSIVSAGDLNASKKEVSNPSPTMPAPMARAKAAGENNARSSRSDLEGVTYKADSTSNLMALEKQRAVINAARNQDMAYRSNMNLFRGRVTDNFNNGIPFANVTNVQDNVGTYTDARGYFNLTSPDSILNVQTRALGFNNYNVQLRNGVADNKVVMQEDQSVASQTLSEKKVNYEQRVRNPNFKFEGEPEPEDGWDTYDNYLANNVNIPQEFKSRKTEASSSQTVEVSFEVNKSGEPYNFKVIKSLCSQCDQEAIRLIKEGPKWKRKNKKGRATVTIAF